MEGVAVRMGERVDELDDLLPAHYAKAAYLDTWDRHLSIAFSNTKGLRNAPGENNCFVNCAVQVFWHLDVFRRSYRRLSGHTCMGNSCIFCALKVIFTQFQYSDKASLQPDALRKALAQTFANQQRFQLGHMDDAAECFENILRRLHFHVASNFNEDVCTAAHCLPHQKFSMAVQEKVVCVCGASTSPLKFHEMVHYVSASALLAQSRQDHGGEGGTHPDHFGLLLRRASAMGDVRNCPASCGKQVQKQRTLLNIPDVVSVGLVWDSDRPSVETTTEVAKVLGTSIHLPEMYHHVMGDPSKLPVLQLVAVVCYYGKHYSTFVFHSKLKSWIYFDDATVREIGPRWSNVVDKCSRGRFQPLLLLYANDNATPIAVDTAPQRRVMANGYVSAGPSETSDGRLDRTHESIKSLTSSRQSTPNPDHSHNMNHGSAPFSPEATGRDSPATLTRDHIRQPSFLSAVAKDRARPADTVDGVGTLPGGAAYKPSGRRPLLDGGANCGPLNPMVEECGNYPDYTLSSGDQYRRPSPLGVESKKPLPMPPNASRGAEEQRKAAWMKTACGKDRGGVDVVRYQLDPSRSHRGTPDFTLQPCWDPAQKGGAGPYRTATPTERCVPGREEKGRGAWAGSQHVVVKPTPTARVQQDSAGEYASHTPVQSGLATLPRPRGHPRPNEPPVHRQASPAHQEVTQLTHRAARSGSPRDLPLPPGTPPPEYNSVVGSTQQAHSRQASTSSQASSMRSSVSMGNLHQLGSGKLSVPDSHPHARNVRHENLSREDVLLLQRGENGNPAAAMKKSESESEALSENSKQYYRRMVENILKQQGVTRSGSSCSTSSVDSDSLMGKLASKPCATTTASTALKVDIPLDNVSLNSLKDSGCGSCDRHSSSSAGSGSVDHLPQYLFNKSMIVPRSINMPHSALDHQTGQYYGCRGDAHRNSPRTVQGGGPPEGGPARGMQPIKESGLEDVPKTSPSEEPLGTKKFIMAPTTCHHPTEPRPPPVPPKNLSQYQIIKSHKQPPSTPHERESSLENLMKEENVNSNVVTLCNKANVLMDKCVKAETQQDMSSALQCGEGALGCLKEAMAHKELNNKAQAYLQKKHSSCLLKVRNLQTRAPASRQESHSSGIGSDITSSVGNSRSSITSNDSDLSDQVLKHSRQAPGRTAAPPLPRPHLPPPNPSHPTSSSPSPSSDPARGSCGQGTVPVPRGHTVDSHNGHHHAGNQRDGHHGNNATHGGPRGGNPTDVSRQIHGRTDSCSSNHPPQGHGRPDSCSSHPPQGHGRTDSCSSNHPPQGHGRTDSCSSNHPPQGRTDSSGNSAVPPPPPPVSDYVSVNSISTVDSSADVYGTLPRNKSRKPGSDSAASPEMYQSFLNKQKCLQAQAATLSPPSLDSGRSDGSSDAGSKMNRTQIRQLLQHSIVQRQWHQQPGSAQHNHHQLQPSAAAAHSSQQQEHRPSVQPCQGPWVGAGTSAQHPQPAQSAQQQRQTQAQQSNYTVPASQHWQRQPQPHPAGYPLPQTTGQSRPVGPGPRAPTPNGVSVGRPRTPTCYTSAGAGCSNPTTTTTTTTTSHTSSVSSQGSSEAGKNSAPLNVARVTPYSHLLDAQPMRCSGSSYLVMMHPSQQNPSSASRGSQGHPSAGSALPFTPAAKPLERSASHLDCRTLGNKASSSALSDQGASLTNTVCNKPHSASVSVASSSDSAAGNHRRSHTSTPVSEGADTPVTSGTPATVRSLLSRFERMDLTASPTSCSRAGPSPPQGQTLKKEARDKAAGRASLRRTRSKSESASSKPKSVLKKSRMKSRPRKSVTFAESLAHFAVCDDDANSGYESATEASCSQRAVDSRLNYSDDDVRLSQPGGNWDCELYDSSSSSCDDCNVEEEEICHLCRRRRSSPGQAFCAKCSFYLAKLNLS